jgi:DNA-binding transcriptional LysR family regulator
MKPILNSRQLHIFATLARCLSFTHTAKELGVTQSAVSHAINALEEDLGCRLVDREHRRVQQTPAGEALRRKADSILGKMAAARVEIAG